MQKLSALIFDVDGTLADTEKDGHLVAFNQAFKDIGLDWFWSEELYGELLAVTGGKERMKYYITEYSIKLNIDHLDEYIAEIHKNKTKIYNDLVAKGGLPLRTGVLRLFKEAREKGIKLAIATTTTIDNVHTLLKSTIGDESIEWFDVIAAGDVVANKKPAPDIYHYALEKMALDQSQCLVFEDSENGIKSSSQAGLETIITINNYTKNHDFDGALIVLDDLGEPDKDFKVIEGDAKGHKMVDMEMLQKLHQQAYAG